MREIYLDNSATTRTDPEVASYIADVMVNQYGNPSSLHRRGLMAQLEWEKGLKRIAAVLGCDPGCITITSGGTEADNLAIFGGAQAKKRRGNKIVTTAFEHAAVLAPFRQLEEQGFQAVYVKPDSRGIITLENLLEAVDKDTILVSLMAVNNEVGTILPVAEAVKGIRKKAPNALIHCDAVQAFCKIPLKPVKWDVDLMTVSGHKIHAPKGVGALYVKKGVKGLPQLWGGHQQNGLRPGTENMPLACGFGLAAEKAASHMGENLQRMEELRAHLLARAEEVGCIAINSPLEGLPYVVNLSVEGFRSEILLHFLEEKGIYVSSGSACSRGEKSHVLGAMGLSQSRIDSALRISFGTDNTIEDIDQLIDALKEAVGTLARNRR